MVVEQLSTALDSALSTWVLSPLVCWLPTSGSTSRSEAPVRSGGGATGVQPEADQVTNGDDEDDAADTGPAQVGRQTQKTGGKEEVEQRGHALAKTGTGADPRSGKDAEPHDRRRDDVEHLVHGFVGSTLVVARSSSSRSRLISLARK